jgi:hypothetical protein
VQEPLQEASHLALQSAVGFVTLHLASQSPAQVDWQDERHRSLLFTPTQVALQLPLQSALQDAAQSNLGGEAVHSAWHDA